MSAHPRKPRRKAQARRASPRRRATPRSTKKVGSKRRRPGARRRAAARSRRRRVLRRILVSAGAVAVAVVLLVLIPLGLARDPEICVDDPATFPEAGIEGWSGEQLDNAATIIRTASARGLERDGQILGVMTAMGESSLINIDYGDWETRGFTNPDGTRTTSVGLFQQQEWWGTVEERMDPATAATMFYERLERLPDWQRMQPSHAIHRVQVNTDRDYYSRFQTDAAAIVDALSGPCTAEPA